MESKMAQKTATLEQNDATTPEAGSAAAAKKPRGRTAAKALPGKKPSAHPIKAGTSKAGNDAAAVANKSDVAAETKASIVLKKLNSPKGATIEAMSEATGWQAHSVRGFLSAVVRKKLGLNLTSEADKDGVRRYRVQADRKDG